MRPGGVAVAGLVEDRDLRGRADQFLSRGLVDQLFQRRQAATGRAVGGVRALFCVCLHGVQDAAEP